jgi:serine/threonine protein kinase
VWPQGWESTVPRPASIGGYRIGPRIGEGRAAEVYLARSEVHGLVALKVLKGPSGRNERAWRLFSSECAILSAIEHEHVVRVFDHGIGEAAYLAMEYLRGGDLRTAMRAGPGPERSLSLLRQAAGAVAAIHRCGIVHRDIKPENFLFRTGGELVLADFGLAVDLAGTTSPMRPGLSVGTPCYASPEQAQGGVVSAATDIYSLGVIFFEMLCGRLPFEGRTLMEIRAQHLVAPIPRLPPDLADFQPIIEGMLQKEARRRLSDGNALLQAIGARSCRPS